MKGKIENWENTDIFARKQENPQEMKMLNALKFSYGKDIYVIIK
jgi:hypothetical protein